MINGVGEHARAELATAETRVFEDAEMLARYAAEWLCARALASDRAFAVCLSGGSTPRRVYGLLAEPAIASRFPWRRVHWFWGDERFVPPNHPDSNYRMVRDELLLRVPVPGENIHAIPTSGLSPEEAAAAYEATLKGFYQADTINADRPLFDVTFLGIGEDGHTASLFPGHPTLDVKDRWVVAIADARPEIRITLTYPVLESSRDAVFLVTGEGKREPAARARAGDWALPAGRIRPVGRLYWFLDRFAAGPTVRGNQDDVL